jgi:hypothetical protein
MMAKYRMERPKAKNRGHKNNTKLHWFMVLFFAPDYFLLVLFSAKDFFRCLAKGPLALAAIAWEAGVLHHENGDEAALHVHRHVG